jgi:hypothetical protein
VRVSWLTKKTHLIAGSASSLAATIARALEDLDRDLVLAGLIDRAGGEEPVLEDQALAQPLEREQTRLVGARAGARKDRGKVRLGLVDADELLERPLGLDEHRRERVLPVVVARRVRERVRDPCR